MWLGPVFQAELLTSSRRTRFFVDRVLYGLLVLMIVTTTYSSMASVFARQGREIPIDSLAVFGQAIFSSFATLQGVIFLVMTPALVAGAIADERQRKTLHYLMASQLSSTEIVVGKVASRLLRLGILGAIGLPVLSLVGLFGGVDYQLVFLVYAATATTTFFLASLAILCSVFAIKPRDAIMQCYFVEILWLIVPPIFLSSLPFWDPFWRRIGEFCRPGFEWVAASSPTGLIPRLPGMSSPFQLIEHLWWMMGLQMVYGTIFLVIAVWRLRPVFRAQDGPKLWARLLGRKARQVRPRWRIFARRECGDDAMLWKELHVNRVGNVRKVVLCLGAIVVLGFTIYSTWDFWLGAFDEAFRQGYWAFGENQRSINVLLRGANGVAIVVILLGMASVSASSITSEREGDTWTNLASSPLDGLELIRGKILGVLWLFRPVAYFLIGCWAMGLLVGAVHPLGVLACTLELVVFAGFVAALGVAVSLRSKNTIQSLTVTIGILVFSNVGYLLLLSLLRLRDSPIIAIGCMPFIFVVSLVGMADLRRGYATWRAETISACVLGTLLYASAAVFLVYYAISRYNIVADRPDRSRNDLTPQRLEKIRKSYKRPILDEV